MSRPPWKGGAVSLVPYRVVSKQTARNIQDNVTPKIGSENRHHDPTPTPLAHLHAETTPWGYTINTRDDYQIPHAYVNNSHFPAASGHGESLGSGSCNFNGVQADRISKKTWEENVSHEGFLKSKAKILKMLEADRRALKAKLAKRANETY